MACNHCAQDVMVGVEPGDDDFLCSDVLWVIHDLKTAWQI
jgi:hypothetical protein